MSAKIALSCLLLTALCVASSVAQASSRYRGPSVGGWRKINIASPEAQDAATKATALLDAGRNSIKAYRLHRLLSAKRQVVAGTNYHLELLIAQTDCNRGPDVNVDNCQAVKTQKCKVTIHVPLQSQTSQLLKQTCEKEKSIRSKPTRGTTRRMPMVGGHTDIDVSSDAVKEAASFASQQLTAQSKGSYQVQHQRIVKATSQVVAGVMYTLTLEVSLTYSQTNDVKTTQCEVKVWDQAWRNPRYILSQFRCNEFIA